MASLTRVRVQSWPRVLASAAVLWVLVGAVVLLATFPYWPTSGHGIALVLLAGPPVYLALSAAFEHLVLPGVQRMSSVRYSAGWYAGVFVLVAAGCAMVALGAWWWLRVAAD